MGYFKEDEIMKYIKGKFLEGDKVTVEIDGNRQSEKLNIIAWMGYISYIRIGNILSMNVIMNKQINLLF